MPNKKSKADIEEMTLDYPGARALMEMLDEIERNIQEARDILEPDMCDENELRLTAAGIDNLRCIVEDAEERLKPIYEGLDDLWDCGAPESRRLIRGAEPPYETARIVKIKTKPRKAKRARKK